MQRDCHLAQEGSPEEREATLPVLLRYEIPSGHTLQYYTNASAIVLERKIREMFELLQKSAPSTPHHTYTNTPSPPISFKHFSEVIWSPFSYLVSNNIHLGRMQHYARMYIKRDVKHRDRWRSSIISFLKSHYYSSS